MALFRLGRDSRRAFGLLFVSNLALLLSACNSNSNRDEFIDSALGQWQGGCQNFGLDNPYGQVTLDVMTDSFEFTNDFYLDPSCRESTHRYRSSGTLVNHDFLVENGELSFANIDFRIEQVTVELLSQSSVDEFNNSARCARTDWTLDVMVDVSNCEDILNSSVPRTEYDVYTTDTAVDSMGERRPVLYTGEFRGLTVETRPSAPDYLNPYWQIAAAESDT